MSKPRTATEQRDKLRDLGLTLGMGGVAVRQFYEHCKAEDLLALAEKLEAWEAEVISALQEVK